MRAVCPRCGVDIPSDKTECGCERLRPRRRLRAALAGRARSTYIATGTLVLSTALEVAAEDSGLIAIVIVLCYSLLIPMWSSDQSQAAMAGFVIGCCLPMLVVDSAYFWSQGSAQSSDTPWGFVHMVSGSVSSARAQASSCRGRSADRSQPML